MRYPTATGGSGMTQWLFNTSTCVCICIQMYGNRRIDVSVDIYTHIPQFCPKRVFKGNNIPIAMSTINVQVFPSKYHSPVKGTRAPWRSSQFFNWGREKTCQPEHLEPKGTQVLKERWEHTKYRNQIEEVPTDQIRDNVECLNKSQYSY